MFETYQEYEPYGDIRVARGALLTWHAGNTQKFMLHIGDSESRIDFKGLKNHLGLSKKQDLRFFNGDVESVVGLQHGGVSVLVGDRTHLDRVYFDRSLVVGELTHPNSRWDFAFSRKDSIVVQPWALVACLSDHEAFRNRLDIYTPSSINNLPWPENF